MQEKKENLEVKTSENDNRVFEIYNKGVKAWYQYKKCQTNLDSEQTFYRLLDLIEDGKELLFDKNNGQHYNEEYQGLFDDMMKALKTRPNTIDETVSYKEIGDEKHPIITLSADDAGRVECFPDEIDKTRRAFEKRQYKYHIPTLLKAHNKLYHMLMVSGKIKQYNPSIDEIIDNMIKTEMEMITNGN